MEDFFDQPPDSDDLQKGDGTQNYATKHLGSRNIEALKPEDMYPMIIDIDKDWYDSVIQKPCQWGGVPIQTTGIKRETLV